MDLLEALIELSESIGDASTEGCSLLQVVVQMKDVDLFKALLRHLRPDVIKWHAAYIVEHGGSEFSRLVIERQASEAARLGGRGCAGAAGRAGATSPEKQCAASR
eukprot:SRR837773.14579.p1 GENE.SRR837773.14579~~SRR837773.14579.p1  ORF type:complete len:105 (-),score=23.56 SRR837773.14579:113-427(-)